MIFPRVFTPGAFLTNTPVSFYTVPAGTKGAYLKKLTITNQQTGTWYKIGVYLVAAGDSPTTANRVLADYSIAPLEAKEVFEVENAYLAAGDGVYLVCDTAGVCSAVMSGIEVQS